MDINCLRVYNILYGLNITEDEFRDIEEEVSHRERTGVYIAKVRDSICIAVCHDDNHKIIIKEIDANSAMRPKNRIMFKTLITFGDIQQEVYVLHRIAQYRASDTEIHHVADNMEELKERIIMRFADEYPKELGGEYDELWDTSEKRKGAKSKKPHAIIEQLKALYWLFGEQYEDIDVFSRLNVARIIKVWSLNNKRVALFQEKECWELQRGGLFRRYEDIDRVSYFVRTYTPKDRRYDYVCPKREVVLSKNSEYAEIWLDDDMFEKLSFSELEAISQHYGSHEGIMRRPDTLLNWQLLNADKFAEIRCTIRDYIARRTRVAVIKEAEEKLAENIKKQFKKGKVTRFGMTFTPNSFSYNGVKVKGDNMAKFLAQKIILLETMPDFARIFNEYVDYLLEMKTDYDYYPYENYTTFTKGIRNFQVGTAKIEVRKEKRGYLINGYRIARDEVAEVLKMSINHRTQKRFDGFVKNVSRVSLKLQRTLEKGYFEFEVSINTTEDCCLSVEKSKINLIVPVTRENDRNHVVLGDKKYAIRNITSFFNLAVFDDKISWRYEDNHLYKLITQFMKAIKGITAEQVTELIVTGKELYWKRQKEIEKENRKKIETSRVFLENAVRLSKAEHSEVGWKVVGKSGTIYVVDKEGKVWKLNGNEKQYLCIIDVGKQNDIEEVALNDGIAKRLLALVHDTTITKEVWNLGDKQDKFWQELQDKFYEKEVLA